jgi:hypothetical protein
MTAYEICERLATDGRLLAAAVPDRDASFPFW